MDHRSNNVDSTLKMKQNPKSDFHRWITLKQSRCLTLKMLKSTLHNVNTTVFQRCAMSFQRCFNVDITLFQRCFSVASTPVKVIPEQICLVKSIDLHKDL